VVVLSHAFWDRRFSRDGSIVGRSIRLNNETFTVVGVAAQGFQGTGVVSADAWVPMTMLGSGSGREAMLASREGGWLMMGGRLNPSATMTEAAQEIDLLGRALNREHGQSEEHRVLRLTPSSRLSGNRRAVAALFTVLMVIVALVLAVACANVAGVLLARGAARRREIAVRRAIGAGTARLVRQLMTETVMLFALGAAGGVVIARIVTSLASSLPTLPFPVAVPLVLDGRVMAFTTVLSFAAAMLAGLSPALQAARADVLTALKDDPRGFAGRSRLRGGFIVAQVAFSLVLVIVAGLFVKALEQAGSRNPGFDPAGVELASLDLGMSAYTPTTGRDFWRELTGRIRQLPGVHSATVASVLPGGFEGIGIGDVTLPGKVSGAQAQIPVSWNIVEPGYFDALRIPMVAGRDFTNTDLDGAPPVAIVSERLARGYWPGENAVGKTIWYHPAGQPPATLSVIGVAGEVKSTSLIDGVAGSFVYLPLQQHYQSVMTVAVRTTGGYRIVNDIRSVVASMDPKLTIVTTQTLAEAAALGLAPQRVMASFSGALGMVGLLLAAIGIYGITSHTVARRTREIGIRVALGAQPINVVGMVVRQGLLLTVIGSAMGAVLAAGAARVFVPFLFDVAPLDVSTFAGAALIVLAVGLAASFVPARRATAVDPVVALHQD
jgi:predicted permease